LHWRSRAASSVRPQKRRLLLLHVGVKSARGGIDSNGMRCPLFSRLVPLLLSVKNHFCWQVGLPMSESSMDRNFVSALDAVVLYELFMAVFLTNFVHVCENNNNNKIESHAWFGFDRCSSLLYADWLTAMLQALSSCARSQPKRQRRAADDQNVERRFFRCRALLPQSRTLTVATGRQFRHSGVADKCEARLLDVNARRMEFPCFPFVSLVCCDDKKT
jgi:hypothetical protein